MISESKSERRSISVGVYDDENRLLRCRQRIWKARTRFEARFPLLIPTYHHHDGRQTTEYRILTK